MFTMKGFGYTLIIAHLLVAEHVMMGIIVRRDLTPDYNRSTTDM